MKIHLLLKKEEIDTMQMDQNKIAVVFDVLLATSTITVCFHYGAKRVIPVMDGKEALSVARKHPKEDVVLVGEYNGVTIDGFHNPAPSSLKDYVKGKIVILSTTNGTVAIRGSALAKKVYAASLLNGKAVSEQIAKTSSNETIIAVCSGSSNSYCMEDFYGAGYFVKHIVGLIGEENVELTDSAQSSLLFYENLSDSAYQVLRDSRVGKMLSDYGFEGDINYVSQKGILPIVPKLINGHSMEVENIVNNMYWEENKR